MGLCNRVGKIHLPLLAARPVFRIADYFLYTGLCIKKSWPLGQLPKNCFAILVGFPQRCGVISYYVKKCLRHFMKNLRFFSNLCPSGEGLSYMVKKNPASRTLRLRRVAAATPPPQCDYCFLPYGKKPPIVFYYRRLLYPFLSNRSINQ